MLPAFFKLNKSTRILRINRIRVLFILTIGIKQMESLSQRMRESSDVLIDNLISISFTLRDFDIIILDDRILNALIPSR